MPTSASERAIVLYFRLTMAWTFLYASSHQVSTQRLPLSDSSNHTKTFHDLFATFTTPAMAPITTILRRVRPSVDWCILNQRSARCFSIIPAAGRCHRH